MGSYVFDLVKRGRREDIPTTNFERQLCRDRVVRVWFQQSHSCGREAGWKGDSGLVLSHFVRFVLLLVGETQTSMGKDWS